MLYSYCLCCSTRSVALRIRLGTYTKGTSLMHSPPPSLLTVKAPISATRLSPVISLATARCFASLPTLILKELNHLRCVLKDLEFVACNFCYLDTFLILDQEKARSAFMAKACSGGISIGK